MHTAKTPRVYAKTPRITANILFFKHNAHRQDCQTLPRFCQKNGTWQNIVYQPFRFSNNMHSAKHCQSIKLIMFGVNWLIYSIMKKHKMPKSGQTAKIEVSGKRNLEKDSHKQGRGNNLLRVA